MFIQTEQTPNPETLKFLPGRVVMKEGTAFFQNIDEASQSPFAKKLLVLEEVKSVFFGSDFITITKENNKKWEVIKPIILGAIEAHYNSKEETIVPKEVNLGKLKSISKETDIFEDFKNGTRDWSSRDNFSIKTYKFQSPLTKFSENKSLCLLIDPKDKNLVVTIRLESKFLSRENNIGDFSYSQKVRGQGPLEIIVPKEAFKTISDRKIEWSKIATMEISMMNMENKQRISLTSSGEDGYLKSIKFTD